MARQPTIKQLEALYWTGRLGSFQSAAKQLHTSQSAVAKRVGELQHLFGQPLVTSGQRRAKLTDVGQRLMESAEDVLAASHKLMDTMHQPADFSGILRLGVSELVAVTWLPLLIDRLKAQYPRAIVDLEVAPGGRILDRLKVGELHLALVAGPLWDSTLESVELAEVEFAWMASPQMDIPNRLLTPQELSRYPMLTHAPDGAVSQIFAQWQRRLGFTMQRAFTANSLMVMVQMTISGMGISSLPTAYAAAHVAEGKLVHVRTTPALPSLKYFAVYRSVDDFPFIAKVVSLSTQVCDFGRNTTVANVPATPQGLS